MQIKQIPILYVDDEETNLFLFEVLLNQKFNIHSALSAADGFKILDDHPEIKLIITDWKMPQMDGLTFARQVKERYSGVKLMMLSAFVKSDEIDSAIQDGILEAYLSKPLNKSDFIQHVNQLVN
ncbi:MAG: response regulator [Cyclobacteriaceae bacterium]